MSVCDWFPPTNEQQEQQLAVKRMKPSWWCLGYVIVSHGGGDGFAVNIDSTASLDELMTKIKQAHPRNIHQDACDMQLYLAKKRNAKWLQDDDADAISLSLGVPEVIAKYVDHDLRIRRTRSLGSYFYSVTTTSDATSDPNGVIHVVVLLPKCLSKNSAMEKSVAENETHSTSVVHDISSMTPQHAMQMRNKLGLRIKLVNLFEPEDTRVEPFLWSDESVQKDQYLAYLRKHIPARVETNDYGDLFVEDAAVDASLLYVEDDRLPFGLCGKADIVVVNDIAKKRKDLLAGAIATILVQKCIEPLHKAQALAQLVAISLNTPEGHVPVVCLTNLSDDWYVYWFNDYYNQVGVEEAVDSERKYRLVMEAHITHPKNAIDFLVAAATSDEYYFRVPFELLTLGMASIDKLVPRTTRSQQRERPSD